MSAQATPTYPGAIPPPPGVVPDLNTPNHREALWIGIHAMMMAVATIFVAVRCYISLYLLRTFNVVEGLLIAGWVFFVTERSLSYPIVTQGHIGADAWNLSTATVERFLYLTNVQRILYSVTMCIIKCSILFQLLYLFTTSKFSLRWNIIVTLITVNIGFWTARFLIDIFYCSPREGIWNKRINATCIDITRLQILASVFNVIVDWLMILLPILWIWRIRTSSERKFGLTIIFAMGVIAGVASIIRLIEGVKALGNRNQTDTFFIMSLWAGIELAAGLIVCSLPALPKLFRHDRHRNAYTSYQNFISSIRRRSPRGPPSVNPISDIHLSNMNTAGTQASAHGPELSHKDSGSAISEQTGVASVDGITKKVTVEQDRV